MVDCLYMNTSKVIMTVLRLNIRPNSEASSITTVIDIRLNSVINIYKGLFLTSAESPRTKVSYFLKFATTKKVI